MNGPETIGNAVFDCVIAGAGPGGLQAAIYLGRFNRNVLIIDRGGGRTAHARSIENFLTREAVSGREIIELGMNQAKKYGVRVERGLVTEIAKQGDFVVRTKETTCRGRFVIVSSGVYDNFPPIENIHPFLGAGFYTCVDCDGYKTSGKKLVVVGNSINTVRLALAMKKMFTKDITLVLYFYDPPQDYVDELHNEGIPLVKGRPARLTGTTAIESLELKDGTIIPCEAVMSNFGFKLNDEFLAGLDLRRDPQGFKYVTNNHFESSLTGLYIVGPLNTGNDQVVIAAGEGAVAAIDINKRLLEV
jgi:thioredoxin reductase (NADPH)